MKLHTGSGKHLIVLSLVGVIRGSAQSAAGAIKPVATPHPEAHGVLSVSSVSPWFPGSTSSRLVWRPMRLCVDVLLRLRAVGWPGG